MLLATTASILVVLCTATVSSSCGGVQLASAAVSVRVSASSSSRRTRQNERFVFEVLSNGLSTIDGDNVVVHRYMGGNEKIQFDGGKDKKNKDLNNVACYLAPTTATASSSASSAAQHDECVEYFPSDTQIRTMMDPFLVFDNYRSEEVTEYDKGFPAHPHKGMLEIRHFTVGGLRHTDSCNRDVLTPPGGGQALFAGRGIIHEEKAVDMTKDGVNRDSVINDDLPEAQEKGFKGFQLWINVPQKFKTKAPNYRSVKKFPTVNLTARRKTAKGDEEVEWVVTENDNWLMSDDQSEQCNGIVGGISAAGCSSDTSTSPSRKMDATVRVIAGRYKGTFGPFTDMIRGGVKDEDGRIVMGKTEKSTGKEKKAKTSAPGPITKETVKGFLYLDVTLQCVGAPFIIDIPEKQNTLVYMYDSHLSTSDAGRTTSQGNSKGLTIGTRSSDNAAFIPMHALAVLGDGDHVVVGCPTISNNGTSSSYTSISFILVTAPPVKEKVFIANGFALSSKEALEAAMNAFNNEQSTWC